MIKRNNGKWEITDAEKLKFEQNEQKLQNALAKITELNEVKGDNELEKRKNKFINNIFKMLDKSKVGATISYIIIGLVIISIMTVAGFGVVDVVQEHFFDKSTKEVYDLGHQEGYTDGYKEGADAGYKNGYDKGNQDATNLLSPQVNDLQKQNKDLNQTISDLQIILSNIKPTNSDIMPKSEEALINQTGK